MTFRTFDIDAGTAATCAETSTPARRTRSRRHASLMSHRTSGSRIWTHYAPQ